MARVNGPSRQELDSRGNELAARVRRAIDSTLRALPRNADVEELNRIRTAWRDVALRSLVPRLYIAWDTAVAGVRTQLEHFAGPERVTVAATTFEIPKVSNALAELFLADATNRLVGIGDHVWEVARAELLEGMQLGEGIDELRERVLASANVSARRAETIARTEVNSAMNNGAYEQMKSLDMPTIKEWIAADDSRTRESHEAVDGEEIAGDAKFTVGGFPMDHPHDLTAPPGETINCRCTIAWEVDFDALDDEDDEVEDEDDEDEDDDDEFLDNLLATAADAFHLPGEHDQSDHGRKGTGGAQGLQRITAMKDAYTQGYTVDTTLEPGASRADIAILTLSDGSKVVRKILKKNETRREYLAGRVFDALKSDDSSGVTTAQVSDDTLITTYVPGQTGGARIESVTEGKRGYDAQEAATKAEHNRQAQLPGAKEMAMLDALIENHDRHSLNWILPDNGKTVEPIDQGAARFEPSYMWNMDGGRDESLPESPVGAYWFGINEFDSGIIDEIKPRYTQEDITRYRASIAQLRDEFQSGEEEQWFDFINRRLAQIEARIES